MEDEADAIGIAELVFFGVDTVIFGFLYKWFSSTKKATLALKSAPLLEISPDLKDAVKAAGREIPYAVVKGTVKALGKPLSSQNNSHVTGVIQEIILKEHKVKWSWATRWWLETEQEVSRAKNTVPFLLSGLKEKGQVYVSDPLAARILALTTISDRFEPVRSGFSETMWGFFRGERTRGYQEVEQMLTEGTVMTGVGKLVLESNGHVTLGPPSKNLNYFLTTQSESSIVRALEAEASFLRAMAVVCGIVGVAIFVNIAHKAYKQYKKKKAVDERRQLLQELRERTRRLPYNETSQAPPCVICLTNPREVVILECGHVCCCADCAENLANTCPICRKPITRFWPAYIS